MAYERITSDEKIQVRVDGFDVAHFEDNGNGMEGEIFEGNHSLSSAQPGKPIRMQPSDLIALAVWLLQKAEERACDQETD